MSIFFEYHVIKTTMVINTANHKYLLGDIIYTSCMCSSSSLMYENKLYTYVLVSSYIEYDLSPKMSSRVFLAILNKLNTEDRKLARETLKALHLSYATCR